MVRDVINADSVPGLMIVLVGLIIFTTVPLKLAGVEGVIEPGTGYPMLAATAFFGIATMFAGGVFAVKAGEMNG